MLSRFLNFLRPRQRKPKKAPGRCKPTRHRLTAADGSWAEYNASWPTPIQHESPAKLWIPESADERRDEPAPADATDITPEPVRDTGLTECSSHDSFDCGGDCD